MLKVGTHVYIRQTVGCGRPYLTGHEEDLVGCYGTVVDDQHYNYYTVEATDKVTGETLLGSFLRNELHNLGPDEPSYRIGDMVRICEMNQEDKDQYPVGWNHHMNTYIGQTLRVKEHYSDFDSYRLEGNCWIWHAVNLKPVSEFVGF